MNEIPLSTSHAKSGEPDTLSLIDINRDMGLRYLTRMKSVWGIDSGKWVDRKYLPEIIEAIHYVKSTTGITKQEILEELCIPSSRYYLWQKQVSSPDFTTDRLKRRTINRLLPQETRAITDLHKRFPYAEPERMASILSREKKVYVSASSVRNVLKRKEKVIQPPSCEVFRREQNSTDEQGYLGPYQKWLQLALFILTPDNIPFVLHVNIDFYSRFSVMPCVFIIGSAHEGYNVASMDILKQLHEKPDTTSAAKHHHVCNELSLFLSFFGYTLSELSPLKHTVNRSYGLLKGQTARKKAIASSVLNRKRVQDDLEALAKSYNSGWPLKEFGYATPKEVSQGPDTLAQLRLERQVWLDRMKATRQRENSRKK